MIPSMEMKVMILCWGKRDAIRYMEAREMTNSQAVLIRIFSLVMPEMISWMVVLLQIIYTAVMEMIY